MLHGLNIKICHYKLFYQQSLYIKYSTSLLTVFTASAPSTDYESHNQVLSLIDFFGTISFIHPSLPFLKVTLTNGNISFRITFYNFILGISTNKCIGIGTLFAIGGGEVNLVGVFYLS